MKNSAKNFPVVCIADWISFLPLIWCTRCILASGTLRITLKFSPLQLIMLCWIYIHTASKFFRDISEILLKYFIKVARYICNISETVLE